MRQPVTSSYIGGSIRILFVPAPSPWVKTSPETSEIDLLEIIIKIKVKEKIKMKNKSVFIGIEIQVS